MSLRSPTEHENADLRHTGMDCRHPDRTDASGDFYVSHLDKAFIDGFHYSMLE